jgi:hypothetical protein
MNIYEHRRWYICKMNSQKLIEHGIAGVEMQQINDGSASNHPEIDCLHQPSGEKQFP